MPTILIVDDSATDRRLAGGLLGQIDDVSLEYAVDGGDALLKMELHVPDIIVTDLDMPSINGLELVEVGSKGVPGHAGDPNDGSQEAKRSPSRRYSRRSSYVPKRHFESSIKRYGPASVTGGPA